MSNLGDLEAKARASLTGQALGATRILRVRALPSAVVAGAAPVQAQPMRIRNPGCIFAMYGQVQSAVNADAATTEVRVQFNGSRDLITDGDNGTFAPIFALFGQAQNWFPLEIDARQPMDLVAFWQVLAGGNNATPSLLFGFIEYA